MQNSRVEDNHFPQNSLIRIKEKLVDLSYPKVMGIVNITDDSFHKESRVSSAKQLVNKVLKHLEEGADIIDIGAQSTRPGAIEVTEKEELEKIENAVKIIKNEFPNILLSIDTYRSKTAKVALDLGADMINDVSAGNLDENMLKVVGEFRVPYILMHMRGTPLDMQNHTDYKNITTDLMLYFSRKIEEATSFGIKDIIIDPGFGFSKTLKQNFELLDKLDQFKILERPILIGISRKSMIYKKLQIEAKDALNGTSILNTKAILKGANILRVHDVREAREIIELLG